MKTALLFFQDTTVHLLTTLVSVNTPLSKANADTWNSNCNTLCCDRDGLARQHKTYFSCSIKELLSTRYQNKSFHLGICRN
jgi:hypothetical protein